MTPSELKRLKELAEKATPGPWRYANLNGDDRTDGSTWGAVGLWTQDNKQIFGSGDGWSGEFNGPSQQDTDYIVAANPQTILKMIETIERYREALELYADPDNWNWDEFGIADFEFIGEHPNRGPRGAKARAALAAIKEKKDEQ